MDPNKTPEQREESRYSIESVVLPFLGSRKSDDQPFQYLIKDISKNGAKIYLPRWVIRRERLYIYDTVNLHLPFKFENQTYYLGVIKWENWDQASESQICGLMFQGNYPANYPVFISITSQEIAINLQAFSSFENLLKKIIKDTVFIKKGMLIYLKHLKAFFSRLSQLTREEYTSFRQVILDNIIQQTQEQHDQLNHIFSKLQALDINQEEIIQLIDLDEIRNNMESGIYVDLFQFILDSNIFNRYLLALKDLERRLYVNYNTIVMLYLKSLEGAIEDAPAKNSFTGAEVRDQMSDVS